MKMKTIYVKCTFVLPVEVPDDPDYDAIFDIEDNHCPGTGRVGQALEAHMERHDGVCWACNIGGKCEIIENPYAQT